MVIRAVLFDLDETLLTRGAAIVAFIGDQYDRHQTALVGVDRATFVARFLALEDAGRTPKVMVYPALVADLGITGISAQALFDDYQAVYPSFVVLSAGARETLLTLRARGIATGIVTNGSTVLQTGKIEATGLRPLLDIVLVSEDEGVAKPDRAIFDRALNRLGVTSAEAMFVGDNPIVDVVGAQNAGLVAVWYHSSTEWPAGTAPPEHTIKALSEIIPLCDAGN
ncbi:HAD family hydrolase [Devosia sp. 2618]|uniref:HAD family hydrolase n=1 Tax=Devosia sp. 2618 TaxID=3156454 RepID=UPI00339298F3